MTKQANRLGVRAECLFDEEAHDQKSEHHAEVSFHAGTVGSVAIEVKRPTGAVPPRRDPLDQLKLIRSDPDPTGISESPKIPRDLGSCSPCSRRRTCVPDSALRGGPYGNAQAAGSLNKSGRTQSRAKPMATPSGAGPPPTYIGFRVLANIPVVASASVGCEGLAGVPMRPKIRLALMTIPMPPTKAIAPATIRQRVWTRASMRDGKRKWRTTPATRTDSGISGGKIGTSGVSRGVSFIVSSIAREHFSPRNLDYFSARINLIQIRRTIEWRNCFTESVVSVPERLPESYRCDRRRSMSRLSKSFSRLSLRPLRSSFLKSVRRGAKTLLQSFLRKTLLTTSSVGFAPSRQKH